MVIKRQTEIGIDHNLSWAAKAPADSGLFRARWFCVEECYLGARSARARPRRARCDHLTRVDPGSALAELTSLTVRRRGRLLPTRRSLALCRACGGRARRSCRAASALSPLLKMLCHVPAWTRTHQPSETSWSKESFFLSAPICTRSLPASRRRTGRFADVLRDRCRSRQGSRSVSAEDNGHSRRPKDSLGCPWLGC